VAPNDLEARLLENREVPSNNIDIPWKGDK
jgi:hypothetical protein